MTTRIRPHSTLLTAVVLAFMVASAVVVAAPTGLQAAETPRRGGVLLAVIGADPPSLDPHQGAPANGQLVIALPAGRAIRTISRRSSETWPQWKITPDGLTYTFRSVKGSSSTTARH
jgi:ABC-type transport system substrate-binding protein